ncbi:substrate-binding domain-containing protein [Pantoea sp. LMR881]|uniref:substrate-binding domain-containing protein n=2 Tax=Pantoea sp. LMR881 TaxID=3014336 RepID=UPI0022AFD1EC|nr:substrate-binding domain-containing protein [Pantoea sp. LMR881]MCZ4061396.1 substrate-binding domain-containing protein [Pantoea sp. LMR881]
MTERKGRVIGVISEELTHPCVVKMLNEVTHQLNTRGALTLLLNVDSPENRQSVMHFMTQQPIDGVLVVSTVYRDALNAAAEALSSTLMHLCSSSDHNNPRVVTADDYTAGEEIAQLMLSQGHQRFGYMQGYERLSSPLRRMKGFAAGLEAADKTAKVLVAGSHDRELAYQAMMAYLKRTRASERIEALFCENDLLAFGTMQAIRDFGQGTHIAVVGFGDIDEARTSTWHLTSWSQHNDLLVTEALNRLLDNRYDENGLWRRGELQIRHSHLGKEVPGEMAQCGCASRH